MEKSIWYSLSVKTEAEAEDAVNFALNELGALGIELSTLGERSPEIVTVIGYFDHKISDTEVDSLLGTGLDIYDLSHSAVIEKNWETVIQQDWLAEWKKHWKPTETNKFIIAPPWEEVSNSEKIVVRIEPNMAFGTGTHETTRLCLRAVEKFYKPEMSFFDVGTGTGILAVCAAKIADANTKIAGCDTDEDSVKIAKENAALNSVSRIDFFLGSISGDTTAHDFVCANVTADVIVPLLPELLRISRRFLILSGILQTQEIEALKELNRLGIEDFSVEADGEWIGISIVR